MPSHADTWLRSRYRRSLSTVGMVGLVWAIVASTVLAPSASADPISPGSTVPDANDPSCEPSAEHPRPVVLVHGTWQSPQTTWSDLAPKLVDAGYCVFSLEYGQRTFFELDNLLDMVGGSDIAESATELAAFVDQVRAETGSEQVDIVGHSQGGVVARQYLRFNGGASGVDPAANKVHSLVTLGATNHGTTYDQKQLLGKVAENFGVPVQAMAAAAVGPSAVQQMVGSPFLGQLNAGGDTVPGIDYTVIATQFDTVSTPPSNTFLTPGPGAVVHNRWVQDVCPDATTDHTGLTIDTAPIYMTMVGLDPSYDVDPADKC